MSELLVTLPEYYQTPVKPRGFSEFCAMFEATNGPLGLWELQQFDHNRGEITRRIWGRNVITDNGATAMLKNNYNNAGSAISIFNQLALSQDSGSCTLTSAIALNTSGITSLSVTSLPMAIAPNATLVLGYGTGTNQIVTVTGAGAAQFATTIPTVSFNTDGTHSYAIGTNVVPQPLTSDNPSSLTNGIYSGALAPNAFAFSGSGSGNRQVIITFVFPSTDTAGSYTDIWTCNANPVVANATANHLIVPAMTLNSTTSVTCNVTEKI